MIQSLYIGLGAAVGANLRYFISLWAAQRFGSTLPYGTLIVNISGSLLLGFLLTLFVERLSLSTEVKLMLAVGFLGSYTTFSTFAVESYNLWQASLPWLALLNLLGHNLLGLLAVIIGIHLGHLLS